MGQNWKASEAGFEALFRTIHPIFWVPICAVDPC